MFSSQKVPQEFKRLSNFICTHSLDFTYRANCKTAQQFSNKQCCRKTYVFLLVQKQSLSNFNSAKGIMFTRTNAQSDWL